MACGGPCRLSFNKLRPTNFTQYISLNLHLITANTFSLYNKFQFIENSRYYSTNHEKTVSIIDKGINHSSINYKVKLFLQHSKQSNFSVTVDNPICNIQEDVELPHSLRFDNFNKADIISEIQYKAGVYRIRIDNHNDFYIGSATDLYQRFI